MFQMHITIHDAFDIADPNSMQDVKHVIHEPTIYVA